MTDVEGLSLRFPAKSGYLRICRLNAATCASELGFDVEELDDLRLAVNEAVSWVLADEEAGGEVEVSLRATGRELAVDVVRSGSELPRRELDDLVHAILGATCERYSIDSSDEQRSVSLAMVGSGSASDEANSSLDAGIESGD